MTLSFPWDTSPPVAFYTIAKIEAGATPDPRIETVKKIADALGVPLDDLMK